MAKKILGIDNLDVIRDFVLSKLTSESDELRRELTEENAIYLQQKIVEASTSLKTDYESKYDDLNNQLAKLKLEGADAAAIAALELRIDALNNNYVDQQNSLSRIEDSVLDIENSIMSPGQLNELVNTALIEKTTITDDMVEAPNVYTKNLVALIAKFGTVRALNIIGDEIEGKTIKSIDGNWHINKDGDGRLANGNITWDKDGNVTFGDNVKIGWGNVTDTPDDFGSGVSTFKSTVFTRTNTQPATPTGGSYSKPTPDEDIWSDGIPNGEEKLWASTRVFTSDGGSKQQANWTEPAQMTDTTTFDVEFSSVENNPGNPTDNPSNWSNDSGEDTIWMATRTISNGQESAWSISKIKGEKGADGKDGIDGKDGKDGTSISIAGHFSSEEELLATYPSGPDPVTNAYVVAGDLYVWASDTWKNVGKFSGTDGKDGAQVYLHIKYADSIAYDLDGKNVISVDWTDNDGEARGPYQGMYSDYVEDDSTDFTKYKWFQIDAEKAVLTEIGKYQITSNTIAGKTIHSTTEIPLVDGTTFETFDDDGKSLGTTTSDGVIEGPAWQLRNMGDGYLAKGNIRWDAAGNVEFGPDVKLGWNDEWNDHLPEAPEGGVSASEVESMISTEISKYEVKAENIKGTTLEGKTIKSSDDAWKIGKDGDGWLANKNISWDTNGNLEVKGIIKGVIGDEYETVKIDGDLVIKNDDSTTTVLSGDHNYENPLDMEHTEGRNITISSGLCDTLYTWNIDASQPVTVADSIDDGFVPTQIYTKYQYEDSKNGTEVTELYYEYDGKLFVWLEYDSAVVNSRTVVKTENEYEYTKGAYISVRIGSVTYKYNYGEPFSIADDVKRQADTANTNIFSDGTIYTNSIVANDGQFYGRIDSDGVFRGTLENVSGSIKGSTIKQSDIVVADGRYFSAANYEYKLCECCDSNLKLVKSYGDDVIDLSTKYKSIQFTRVDFAAFIVNLIQKLGPRPINAPARVLCRNLQQGRQGVFAFLVCGDNRAIKDCTDADVQGKCYPDLKVSDILSINSELGDYPVGLIHFVQTRTTRVLISPKAVVEKFDEELSAMTNELFTIKPNLSISGKEEKIKFKGQSWSYQERDSKSRYVKSQTIMLGRTSVSENTKLTLGSISFTMTGYQPRINEGHLTDPKLDLYWRYVGKTRESDKHYIGSFNSSNTTRKNEQYNGRQYQWVGSTTNKEFNITETGDIEIMAKFSATITKKQLRDYPYVSVNLGDITCETTSSFNAPNNCIYITKSGIIIKAEDGGTFSTVGGEVSMISEDANYALKVTNDGIQICKNGTWSTL